MIRYISLRNSKQYVLPFYREEQARQLSLANKGWSYSYVYHFTELKNIFIALRNIPYKGIIDFSKQVIASGLPYVNTPWDSRRVLEQLNALINFGLISKSYEVVNNSFIEQDYTVLLSENDLGIFTKIYHEYFRFKEIHSWLINPHQDDHELFLNKVTEYSMQHHSSPIFPCKIDSRFNDAFLFTLADNTDVFRIPSKSADLMRFWDVYVTWGRELGLLEKFNLKNLDVELENSAKSFSCVYYVNPEKPKFSLLDFIRSEYQGRNVHVPKLILKIALRFRHRIDDIKQMIIEQVLADSNSFSLQRTSEIFIRNTEMYFVPKYRDFYISHLHVR